MKNKKKKLREETPEVVYELGYRKWQRTRAVLELLVGTVFLALAVWLWWNTRGTKLLFTDASLGRVSRYYWIFLAVAAVLLAVGALTLRKRRIRKTPDTGTGEETVIPSDVTEERKSAAQGAEAGEETVILSGVTEERKSAAQGSAAQGAEGEEETEETVILPKTAGTENCPACGKAKKAGTAFCIYCGYKF